MNAYTTTSTRNTAHSDGKLSRMFRAFCIEVRRAIETVGAAYRNGPLPPL